MCDAALAAQTGLAFGADCASFDEEAFEGPLLQNGDGGIIALTREGEAEFYEMRQRAQRLQSGRVHRGAAQV